MKHKLLLIFVAACAGLMLALLHVPRNAVAVSDADLNNSVVSENYNSEKPLQAGLVVQVSDKNARTVIPATNDKLRQAFGVVVSNNTLPISISSGQGGQVFIASSGRHSMLTTTENGGIRKGDLLAISSINGTLMKAGSRQEYVFAKALDGFDGKNNVVNRVTLKSKEGETNKKVALGYVSATILIIKNPDYRKDQTSIPKQFQKIAENVTEKPVSMVKMYVSVAIMAMSIVIAGILLYAGVRGSIISIGRNPLSKRSILRGLMQVIIGGVLVLIIGLFTVYLLLRL